MSGKILAFLAPVPKEHLESAEKAFGSNANTIFGTNDHDFFRGDRIAAGAEVFIYASRAESQSAEVTWKARFVRYTLTEEMRHEERQRRPPKADSDTPFVGYWEVRELNRLDVPIPMDEIPGTDFNPAFIPHGPTEVR